MTFFSGDITKISGNMTQVSGDVTSGEMTLERLDCKPLGSIQIIPWSNSYLPSEGCTGEYWLERVVAVQKPNKGQFSPVRLKEASSVRSRLHGTRTKYVHFEITSFRDQKFTAYGETRIK